MPKKAKAKKSTGAKTPPKARQTGLPKRVWGDFRRAWQFFTRVPLPGEAPKSKAKLADAASAFATVGFVIGCGGAVVLWLAHAAGAAPMVAALSGLGAAALMTGALHEDGLADVADGFGGGASKTKKLEIMKDSRIGTFGVLALVFSVGLKAALLASIMEIEQGPGLAVSALIVAHTLSRAGLPLMMVRLQPVRSSGLGKSAGRPRLDEAVIAAAIGLLLAFLMVGPTAAIAAGALVGLGFEATGVLASRQIGGLTGDVLGFAQQVAELLVLVVMAAVLGGVG